MSSPAATYVRGIHQKFDFYAAWPPNQERRLGDVGRLVAGRFQRVTTLNLLGVKFTERAGPPGRDLSHTSGSSVSIQFKAQGQTLPGTSIPQAKAGALVEFSASGAFVFQTVAPAVREIEDQVRLSEDILGLFRKVINGKRSWKEEWCVVTELLTADKVTVLVSSSGSSKVELAADGLIPAGPAPLASVGGGLSVVTQKGEMTSVLAESSLTPLFRVARVRRSVLERLLGGDESAEVRRGRLEGRAAAQKRVLEPVPLTEALVPAGRKGKPATTPKKRRSAVRGQATNTAKSSKAASGLVRKKAPKSKPGSRSKWHGEAKR